MMDNLCINIQQTAPDHSRVSMRLIIILWLVSSLATLVFSCNKETISVRYRQFFTLIGPGTVEVAVSLSSFDPERGVIYAVLSTRCRCLIQGIASPALSLVLYGMRVLWVP